MNVSAILLTKGDTDMSEIFYSLACVPRIQEIVLWDNSRQIDDAKVWGRHVALTLAKNRVIYSQDDDLVHSPEAIDRILDAYIPGAITGCMWPEWSDGAKKQGIRDGYDDLVFPGSGSVYDREVPLIAANRYLEHYPEDDFFRLWCDCAIGIIAPTRQLDERFEILEAAHKPDRMARLPNGPRLKRHAIYRARRVRDGWMAGKYDAMASDSTEEQLQHEHQELAGRPGPCR